MANRRFIDFPIASTVGDNDIVLIWQDGLNKQTTKGTLIQGVPMSLEELTDVDIAGLINGQILQYNSVTGKWENVDRTDIDLDELGDVTIVSPSNGQVLIYNSSTSKWENSSIIGGFVPYTGATADVDLGTHDLTAERGTFANNGSSDTLTVNHTSGSGYGIIVTKGGNNEALYVNKTSGSGNAMRVVGGRTSLVDLSLSSVSNATGNFLTISGNVVHQRTAAQTLTDIGGQAALTNPVTGTGTTNFLPKFTGATTLGNSVISDTATEINIPKRIFLNSGGQNILFTPNLSGTVNRIEGSSGIPLQIVTAGSSLAFAAGGATTQATLFSSGNFVINSAVDNGAKFQVTGTATISSTLSALKGDFGSAFTSTNVLQAIAPSATNSDMFQVGMLGVSNGLTLKRVSSAFIMDWDGSAIFNGTLKTSSPSGSTAQPFKVGSVTTTTDVYAGTVLKMDINGTVYNIMIAEPPL